MASKNPNDSSPSPNLQNDINKQLEHLDSVILDYVPHLREEKLPTGKKNIEKLIIKVFANDKTSFWRVTVLPDTTAKKISKTLSNKFHVDCRFRLFLDDESKPLPKDTKILTLIKSWSNHADHVFFVKPLPVKTDTQKLPITFDDERAMTTIEHLNISPKWHIDLKNLKLTHLIGGGNFAKVAVGEYKNQIVAVKKLINTNSYEMHKYVQRELDLLQTLEHPKIIKFIGACQTDKAVFILTEYLPRGDLKTLLQDEEFSLSWKLRVNMALDVAEALEYFISKNYIHRDLKSSNLLVQSDFSIKICDFGLARDKSGKGMTTVGTDEWMSPEVLMGGEYDESADIFSFGMVMIELIIRANPPARDPRKLFAFPFESFVQTFSSQLKDCPEIFGKVAFQCLQMDPQQRPKIQTIVKELKSIKIN